MEGKFQIDFKTDNAAFEDNMQFEVIEILKRIIKKVDRCENGGQVFDSNGNNIGEWGYY